MLCYAVILCAVLLCSIAHSIICTQLFCGKIHSDWFNRIEILHGEKVGYCYPSGLENTLCKWDICPAGHERVNWVITRSPSCTCCLNANDAI